MKGETVEEIVGFAEAIRAAAVPLPLPTGSVLDTSGTGRDALVDTCGTGGDASGTFNISTATAFVVAGAGVRVAKHGNRSVTSKCGSADVMESLGVNIELPPPAPVALPASIRLGSRFSLLPRCTPAMKHVQAARRELRLRTIFNLLGPLTNPARAACRSGRRLLRLIKWKSLQKPSACWDCDAPLSSTAATVSTKSPSAAPPASPKCAMDKSTPTK